MFVILLVGRLRQGNANSQPGWATYQDPVLKNRTKLQQALRFAKLVLLTFTF